MTKIDLPCFTPKSMYDFLISDIPWHAWQALSNMIPAYLEHIASCNDCQSLFCQTLFNLRKYEIVTENYLLDGYEVIRELKKEFSGKVKVELYQNTDFVDLSTLVDTVKILILVQPENVDCQGFPEHLIVVKIVINEFEIEFDRGEEPGIIANDFQGLTKEKLSEILRQYKLLIKPEKELK